MKIMEIQRDIEESLASLRGVSLPPSLQGLRHLPVVDHAPEVSIRYKGSRRIRGDADASYFDPGSCELVISFSPTVAHDRSDTGFGELEGSVDAFDTEQAALQLVAALTETERRRPFVALKWFRDKVLPQSGHGWAEEAHVRGAVLRHATDQRLVLTGQVPNPNQPLYPVTTVRVNRRHPRLQARTPAPPAAFTPVRIRGGAVSDTVLGDRR